MEDVLVYLLGFASGVVAWATVGEWAVRTLARRMLHH